MAMYVAKKYFDKMSNDGINFMDEDWDNCIIIDACRYDTFKEKNTIPGDLKARRSKGSSTFEVFEKNFQNSTHHDTVYITANPVPRVKKWVPSQSGLEFSVVMSPVQSVMILELRAPSAR